MRTRLLRRLAVIVAGVVLPLLVSAGPALAKLKPDDGEVPGPSLGTGDTILIFVVAPIGAFLVISALALLPSALRRPRYRPGAAWDRDPVWVGAPDRASDSSSSTSTSSVSTARGGASAEW